MANVYVTEIFYGEGSDLNKRSHIEESSEEDFMQL